jgi:hypothetical protein
MPILPRPVPGVKFDSADRRCLRRARNPWFSCSPEYILDVAEAEFQAVDAICRGLIPRDVVLRLDTMVAE